MELKTSRSISHNRQIPGCQPTWFGCLSFYARVIENSDSGGSE